MLIDFACLSGQGAAPELQLSAPHFGNSSIHQIIRTGLASKDLVDNVSLYHIIEESIHRENYHF